MLETVERETETWIQLYSLCHYLDIILYFLITYTGLQGIKWWSETPWNVEDYARRAFIEAKHQPP